MRSTIRQISSTRLAVRLAAVGILALDDQPPAEAMAEVLSLDEVTRVSVVNLPPSGEMPAWMGGAS